MGLKLKTFKDPSFFDVQANDLIRINYYLSAPNKSHYYLPNEPDTLNIAQVNPHEHFYAIDGTPLNRTSKKVTWQINIEGFSGVNARQFLTRTVKLTGVEDILKHFEEGLRLHRNDDFSFLRFYDLKNGRMYSHVHPVSFVYERAVNGSRLGYRWKLQLVSYSELVSFDSRTAYDRWFQDLEDSVNQYTTKVNALNTQITLVSDRVNLPARRFLQSVGRAGTSTLNIIQNARGVVQSTRQTLGNAINTVLDTAIKTVNFAQEVKDFFVEDFASFAEWKEAKEGWADLGNTYKALVGEEDQDTANEIEESQYQAEILAGATGVFNNVVLRQVNDYGAEGGSFLDHGENLGTLANALVVDSTKNETDNEEQDKQIYILKAGDSLYKIASQIFGDANRWHELAVLNGWQDAHTTALGFPPSAGEKIYVPANVDLLGINLIPSLVGRGTGLLTDLKLVNGDLDLVQDLKSISGVANVAQAITNRIRTEQGSYLADTTYGLPLLVENPSLLSLEIIDQLLKDTRVISVENVVVQREDDSLFVSLDVLPFEGDTINLIVPLEE